MLFLKLVHYHKDKTPSGGLTIDTPDVIGGINYYAYSNPNVG